jgi:hypothetical protein
MRNCQEGSTPSQNAKSRRRCRSGRHDGDPGAGRDVLPMNEPSTTLRTLPGGRAEPVGPGSVGRSAAGMPSPARRSTERAGCPPQPRSCRGCQPRPRRFARQWPRRQAIRPTPRPLPALPCGSAGLRTGCEATKAPNRDATRSSDRSGWTSSPTTTSSTPARASSDRRIGGSKLLPAAKKADRSVAQVAAEMRAQAYRFGGLRPSSAEAENGSIRERQQPTRNRTPTRQDGRSKPTLCSRSRFPAERRLRSECGRRWSRRQLTLSAIHQSDRHL